MKKLLLPLSLIICASFGAIGQNAYKLNIKQSTYTDLVNPIILNGPDTFNAEGYYKSYGVVFPVFDKQVSFEEKPSQTTPSLGAFVTADGYVAVYEYPSYTHTIVFDVAVLGGRYIKKDSTSSISSAFEGTPGNGILKFQWKNIGIQDNPSVDYVNFQVWFDQQSNTISYHYGPSNITGNSFDLVIGFFRAPNSFSELSNSSFVTGQSNNIGSLSLAEAVDFTSLPGVAGFPPNGTVYTFNANAVGVNLVKGNTPYSVFPNPANETIHFAGISGKKITVYELSGKILMEQPYQQDLDVSSLADGLYWVAIDNQIPLKFMKQ